jgi:hypothetical protein
MARPFGSKNKRTREVAAAMDALEREGALDPRRWLLTLQAIADDAETSPFARIAACRALAAYRFGLPTARVDITHEAGESWQSLLTRIASSPEIRRSREELESWRERRRLAAVTVEALEEK